MMSALTRKDSWIAASVRWSNRDDHFIMLNIQMLGNAEEPLIDMEDELSRRLKANNNDLATSMILARYVACAAYWTLGLYELIRLLKDQYRDNFDPLADIFRKVSVLRMPLAKHEVIGAPKYRKVQHYPQPIWCSETGKVGWKAFEPLAEEMLEIFRIDLADQFLTANNV